MRAREAAAVTAHSFTVPGFEAFAIRLCQARASLPSALVRKLPSRCTSSDVTAFPVSSVRTTRSARMSHTLRPASFAYRT